MKYKSFLISFITIYETPAAGNDEYLFQNYFSLITKQKFKAAPDNG